jgi:hypothetical protein
MVVRAKAGTGSEVSQMQRNSSLSRFCALVAVAGRGRLRLEHRAGEGCGAVRLREGLGAGRAAGVAGVAARSTGLACGGQQWMEG